MIKKKQKFISFHHKCETESHLIRLSERSVGDPRVCELLVDKVEEKDLGKWRSELENGELG